MGKKGDNPHETTTSALHAKFNVSAILRIATKAE